MIAPTANCTPADLADALTIWDWDAEAMRYRLVGPDDELVPGKGYWIYSSEDQLIQFPEPAER
jgi:hypothetical protein